MDLFRDKENDRFPLMEADRNAVDANPKNSPISYASAMLASPRGAELASNPPWQKGIPMPMPISAPSPGTYGPVSHVSSTNGPEMSPDIHDPTVYSPAGLRNQIPNQVVTVSSQSTDSSKRAKRCRWLKICSVIGTIFMIIGAPAKYLIAQHQRIENEKAMIDDMQKHFSQYEDEFRPAIDEDRFRPMMGEDRDILQYVKQLNSVYAGKSAEDDSRISRVSMESDDRRRRHVEDESTFMTKLVPWKV